MRKIVEFARRPPSQTTPRRQELISLVAFAVVATWAHARSALAVFGEPDAARLANDAIRWHLTGSVSVADTEYRLRTSPLYLRAIKGALDHGLAIVDVPAALSALSAVTSVVALLGIYGLARRVVDVRVAAMTSLVYAVTPAFWLGSVYGMATVPAIAALSLSALAFAHATDAPHLGAREAWGPLLLAALAAFVALALKADLVLCGGLFVALALRRSEQRAPFVVAACALVGLALVGTVGYASALDHPVAAAPTGGLGDAAGWSERFPLHWRALVDPDNAAPITHGMTTLLSAVAALALLHGLVAGRGRSALTSGLLLTALPTLLFWGLRYGNSARHNLAIYPVLVFAVVLFVFDTVNSTRRGVAMLALLLLAARLDQSGGGAISPAPNPLVETRKLRTWAERQHAEARRRIAELPPRRAMIDDYLLPYVEFEAWSAAHRPTYDRASRVIVEGGRQTKLVEVQSEGEAREEGERLRGEGWATSSLRFSLE